MDAPTNIEKLKNNTYLHEDVEVRLTGRFAAKEGRTKTIFQFEITPVEQRNGTWKKWVPLKSMFTIDGGE